MPYFEHNGSRLHYRECGEGRLVVLLPGNTASSAHFVNELERLSSNYKVVSLDFRGTGLSQRLEKFHLDWQIQCADDTAALIQHLGEESAVLIGTSGGALIALLCAAKYPQQVTAVIADSFLSHWEPDMLKAIIAGRENINEMQVQFWAYGHGEDWQQVVNADTQWLVKKSENGGMDITSKLVNVQCPVLLTGSMNDSLLPDVSSHMVTAAQLIPQTELYLCKQGDHPLIWSAPEYFWSVSDIFLSRVLAKPMSE